MAVFHCIPLRMDDRASVSTTQQLLAHHATKQPLHRWLSINPEAVSHFPLFTHTCSLKGCFSRKEQGTVLNVQVQFSRTPTKACQPQGLFSQTVSLSSPQKETCWTTFFWTLKKKSPDSKLNERVNERATSLKAGVALVYSRRAIENPGNEAMTRKCSHFFF